MVFARTIKPESLKALAFGSLSTTYASVGTNSNPWVQCTISNTTDQDVTVSFDGGTTDHFRLATGQILTVPAGDLGMNLGNVRVPVNTPISAKQSTASAPTKGAIVVMGLFLS